MNIVSNQTEDVNTPCLSTRHSVRGYAELYRSHGLSILPLVPGKKSPTREAAGFTAASKEPHEFGESVGVGIATGWISDGNAPGTAILVADLDSERAVELGDQFLPPTAMVVGRKSKQRAHRYYRVRTSDIPPECLLTSDCDSRRAADARGVHPGPRVIRFGGVLDLQSSGQFVAAPPSVHKSGELYEWEGDLPGEPALIDYTALLAAVCKLAEACGAEPETFARRNLPVAALAAHGFVVPAVQPPITAQPVAAPGGPPPATSAPPPAATPHAGGGDDPLIQLDYARYLQQAGLPRTGEGGNAKTYRLLALGVNDLALPRQTTLTIFCREVNTPLIPLDDEWEVCALNRMLDEIESRPADPNRPRGSKRRDRNSGEGDVPEKWDSPTKLAREFAADHKYRFVKNSAFRFTGKAYETCSFDYLRAQLSRFCDGASVRNYRKREEDWKRGDTAAGLEADRKALAEERAKPQSDETAKAITHLERRIENAEKKKPSAAKSFMASDITNVVEALRGICQLPDNTPFNSWLNADAPASYSPLCGVLSVGNGLLDTAANPPTLLPHSRDFFTLIHIPSDYVADAPPPERWLAFLNDVFQGDEDRVAILQELSGACLAPHMPLKTFAILTGSGDNGKSVTQKVLGFMLGEGNTSAVSLDQLAGNRFACFGLLGKLANIVGDQGYVTLRDEGALKTLTGGDLVPFEQKSKDTLFAVNTAKIIVAANEIPRFNDASDAIWNRALILPFTWTVPADRKNPALLTPDYWRDELPGVLTWALAGLHRLRANNGKFTGSAVCDEAKGKHRADSNPTRRFLTENIEAGTEDDHIPTQTAYEVFKGWMSEEGENVKFTPSQRALSAEFVKAFATAKNTKARYGADRKEHRGYSGVRAKEGTTLGERVRALKRTPAEHPTLKADMRDLLKQVLEASTPSGAA